MFGQNRVIINIFTAFLYSALHCAICLFNCLYRKSYTRFCTLIRIYFLFDLLCQKALSQFDFSLRNLYDVGLFSTFPIFFVTPQIYGKSACPTLIFVRLTRFSKAGKLKHAIVDHNHNIICNFALIVDYSLIPLIQVV